MIMMRNLVSGTARLKPTQIGRVDWIRVRREIGKELSMKDKDLLR